MAGYLELYDPFWYSLLPKPLTRERDRERETERETESERETLYPTPHTLHPKPQPGTRDFTHPAPPPCTLHPAPCTPTPKPQTPNPQPQSRNPNNYRPLVVSEDAGVAALVVPNSEP